MAEPIIVGLTTKAARPESDATLLNTGATVSTTPLGFDIVTMVVPLGTERSTITDGSPSATPNGELPSIVREVPAVSAFPGESTSRVPTAAESETSTRYWVVLRSSPVDGVVVVVPCRVVVVGAGIEVTSTGGSVERVTGPPLPPA